MKPRKLSLVKYDKDGNPDSPMPKDIRKQYPLGAYPPLLFVGEIINMPDHCVVVRHDGKVLWGYHTDNFIELTEDEL